MQIQWPVQVEVQVRSEEGKETGRAKSSGYRVDD